LDSTIFLISDQKHIASQQKNQLLELIPIGFVQLTKTGSISIINSKAIHLLQISTHQDDLQDAILADHIDNIQILNKLWALMTHGWESFLMHNIQIDNHYVNLEGEQVDDFFVISIIDVTSSSKALDQATQTLLLGQETEKRRIAREIHDSIGPSLSTVKLHLEFTIGKIENSSIKREVTRINDMVSSISHDLRNISHDLMPHTLIDFGIITAIKQLLKRLNQSQSVYIMFSYNLSDRDIEMDYELNIYRIIQELINNALKHAQCNTMEIKLRYKNRKIHLEVIDDGKGYISSNTEKGIGLFNIKNRLSSINGEMDIKTSPGRGFRAVISIPYLIKK